MVGDRGRERVDLVLDHDRREEPGEGERADQDHGEDVVVAARRGRHNRGSHG
jgi:hypothetical protein